MANVWNQLISSPDWKEDPHHLLARDKAISRGARWSGIGRYICSGRKIITWGGVKFMQTVSELLWSPPIRGPRLHGAIAGFEEPGVCPEVAAKELQWRLTMEVKTAGLRIWVLWMAWQSETIRVILWLIKCLAYKSKPFCSRFMVFNHQNVPCTQGNNFLKPENRRRLSIAASLYKFSCWRRPKNGLHTPRHTGLPSPPSAKNPQGWGHSGESFLLHSMLPQIPCKTQLHLRTIKRNTKGTFW